MNTIKIRDFNFNLSDSSKIHQSFWKSAEKNEWEPYTFDLFDKFLTKDTIYIDIGAWIGPTTLYASKLCKMCYSIEPDPVAYKILFDTINVNNLENVKLFNCSIFNYDGILQLGNNGNLGDSGTRTNQLKNLFETKCYKLSTFANKIQIDNQLFVKMDVEGSEIFIVEDIDFFKKYTPTLYISAHYEFFKETNMWENNIKNVSKLYKNHYDVYMNKLNLVGRTGSLVFTNL